MRARQRNFVVLSLAVLGMSIVGLVISVIAKWPAQFGGRGDPNEVATEFLSRGTALTAPLARLFSSSPWPPRSPAAATA